MIIRKCLAYSNEWVGSNKRVERIFFIKKQLKTGRGDMTLINKEGGFFLRFYKWIGECVSNIWLGAKVY